MTDDLEALRLLKNANEGDTEAAAELLIFAAGRLAARRALPDAVADHLAAAFMLVGKLRQTEAGNAIEPKRRSALATMLGIVRTANRPRKRAPNDVDRTIARYGNEFSERDLARELASVSDMKTTTAWKVVSASKSKIAYVRDIIANPDSHKEAYAAISGMFRQ